MYVNLFNTADLKTGIFNADGTYNQWRTASRCIEIPVAANTSYYFRYGSRSCNFAHILLVSSVGAVTKYGHYAVVTTAADTSSVKITFVDDIIIGSDTLDYGQFTFSEEPFFDTLPFSVELLLRGFYPINTGYLLSKNDTYRSFGFICRPGHTYSVLYDGAPAAVFGLNQYDKSGGYLGRVTSASSVTAQSDAAVIGVVFESAAYANHTLFTVNDNGAVIDPPEPVFGYGVPYYSGPALKVGSAAAGSVVLPYSNATAGESYSLLAALSGTAAAGLVTPITCSGAYAAAGNITFQLTGTPTTAGELTATITGTKITDPTTLRIAVAEPGTVDPPAETYHCTKVPCKPEATYNFKYNGAPSSGATFSYFSGALFLGRVAGQSTIITPAGCDTLGVNLPNSPYPDFTKVSLEEAEAGGYKSLVQLTQDVAALQAGSGGSTPPEPTLPYYDINFYLFGDSITAANITRWVPTFMSLMTFKHIENFAVGGANYTCSADVVEDLSGLQQGSSNKIWNQLNRLKAKVAAGESPVPDVIVILAGINDRYSQLGDPETAFDYTVDYSSITVTDPLTHNLAGAFRFTMEAILNEWPDVRIIIATPLPVGGSTREKLAADNATVEAITRTLTTCARKMALPVINQAYECGISPYREVGEYLHFNSDGLHPNQHGGEKIGRYLARRIAGLLGTAQNANSQVRLVVNPTTVNLPPNCVAVTSNTNWITQ